MSNRKALAGAVASALLAMCGLAKADTNADGLTLNQPQFLDDAPAPKPLTAGLDKVGAGKYLDDAGITVGGYIEGSWTVSDHNPPGNNITGRYFDFENQDLTLNQLDLYLDRAIDSSKGKFDIGGHLEMIYGGDSRLIHGLGLFDYHGLYHVPAGTNQGPDEQFDLNQAYITIAAPVVGLSFEVGKFDTLLGYEVISPIGNALYSHSFLFAYAIPLTNTGFLAQYQVNPNLFVQGGLTRGWDNATEDDNGTMDGIGQIVYTLNADKNQKIYVNFEVGPDQPGDNDNWRDVLDLIYTQKLADQLSIAVNADYGYQFNANSIPSGSDAQWYGIAGYATYTLSSMFAITGRLEYFNDDDGYRGLGTTVYEATVGVAITPLPNDNIGKNLVIRPEVRFDYGNDPVFNGGTAYQQGTFGVDAYFAF